MGFYQPAQLVQDAQRHSVRVQPADVRYSDWDCSLESYKGSRTPDQSSRQALRLGLRMVKGMRESSALRLVQARTESPFSDVQDLTTRAELDRYDLAVLAEAAALRGLAGHRHRARWEIAAAEKPQEGLPLHKRHKRHKRGQSPFTQKGSDPFYENVSIRPPSEVDDTRADYASTGLTLGRHPIALLRPVLRRRRAITARELNGLQHGTRIRACGLITMRQRPATASGTIFLTLEDETGFVNAVVWPRLWEKQRAEILGASVLAVDGVVETDGDVHHLIAERVHDFSHLAGGLNSKSRDFC